MRIQKSITQESIISLAIALHPISLVRAYDRGVLISDGMGTLVFYREFSGWRVSLPRKSPGQSVMDIDELRALIIELANDYANASDAKKRSATKRREGLHQMSTGQAVVHALRESGAVIGTIWTSK